MKKKTGPSGDSASKPAFKKPAPLTVSDRNSSHRARDGRGLTPGSRGGQLDRAFTPRFWDKAEARAVETLEALSPRSRDRASRIARDAAIAAAEKANPGRAHRGGGGGSNAPTPGGSQFLGDLPSALPSGRRDGKRARGGDGDGGGGGGGDGGPRSVASRKKLRRPPALKLCSDLSAPDEAGTPLLALGGSDGGVVGNVPGLRSDGRSLRKAVLEKWVTSPWDPVPTPNTAETPLDPLAFLTTPR